MVRSFEQLGVPGAVDIVSSSGEKGWRDIFVWLVLPSSLTENSFYSFIQLPVVKWQPETPGLHSSQVGRFIFKREVGSAAKAFRYLGS